MKEPGFGRTINTRGDVQWRRAGQAQVQLRVLAADTVERERRRLAVWASGRLVGGVALRCCAPFY